MGKQNHDLIGGITLLIVGGYFLMRNMGWLPHHINWDLIWPVIIIGLGVWLIVKNR